MWYSKSSYIDFCAAFIILDSKIIIDLSKIYLKEYLEKYIFILTCFM